MVRVETKPTGETLTGDIFKEYFPCCEDESTGDCVYNGNNECYQNTPKHIPTCGTLNLDKNCNKN